MNFYSKKVKLNGASYIGKSHIACSIPNQDCLKYKKTKYGVYMCVCDGVGSNKYSHYGSKAACKAGYIVFKQYINKEIEKENIGQAIELQYKKLVKDKYKIAASTTCLFVFVYNNSNIVIGQAGDGIILIKIDDKLFSFMNKQDEFMNEVKPLSCKYDYKYWKIKSLKFDFNKNSKLEFLLTTDGISEDILPDKRNEFFEYFQKINSKGKKALKKELKKWNVPSSNDDKTIIAYSWRK